MLRLAKLIAGLAALMVLAPVAGHADDYPSRPITIIVPFSAGGGSDVVARIIADGLDKQLGQRVIIENVTGAGGTTGVRRAAQAAPDGYTMVTISPGTHSAAPALYKNLGYDPINGFEVVGLTGSTPIVLVARDGIPAKNMAEFVAYLKAHEKTVTLAHVGPGSMTHLSCSMLDSIIGINPVAASYRGTPPLMQDLLSGRVDYTCQQPNGVISLVNEGKIRAFAVADDRRSPSMPDVPTADEVGYPGFKSTAWAGLVMPKGTPDAIVNKVNQALSKVLDNPNVIKRMADLGVTPMRPEQRSRQYQLDFMKKELERYTTLMHKIGIKPQ
jgi:tripartite-type tricarboxylate transporter receptor subunit TctC